MPTSGLLEIAELPASTPAQPELPRSGAGAEGVSGPAAMGVAVLMNDSAQLRDRLKKAHIRHATEMMANDTLHYP